MGLRSPIYFEFFPLRYEFSQKTKVVIYDSLEVNKNNNFSGKRYVLAQVEMPVGSEMTKYN